jgi:SAM-dependent methyltransferase
MPAEERVQPDASTHHYVIRGGRAGRERLRVLSRVMWPTTSALFERVGVPPEARCLDVGCGGGDVTCELARLVPKGSVLGVDIDDTKLELARSEAAEAGVSNVAFRFDDVGQPPSGDERFNVIYVRFVLTHVPDPGAVVRRLVSQLAPGGALLTEDIDCSGHFCFPESSAFRRCVELYAAAAHARGCDPDIGPRIPSLLAAAGLTLDGMKVVQPAGFEGDVKLISPITLEAIHDSITGPGLATEEELSSLEAELWAFAQQEGTVLSIPRVVQAWARNE